MDEELIAKLFKQNWNYKKRNDILERLKKNNYDIIVIGGGITGAGVAREATLRGLSVALVDMQDFAAGTSSRSSKLAHGGIRYLNQGERELVKEATTERNWLLAHLSHLVRPIPFLFGAWKGGWRKTVIKGAIKIYDYLSDNDQIFKNSKQGKWYDAQKIIELEPKINKEGLLGGGIYYDNNIDDARLTIETIKEAMVRGADALNYCKVINLIKENEKIIGIKCLDLEKNHEFIISGKLVVNATGIWTDEIVNIYPYDIPSPVIRPTKGVHLTYLREDIGNNLATIIKSITDDRAFFVLPRGDFTVIGTTDTDYSGDLTSPFCNREDADYLITSVKHYFPEAKLDYEKIISTWAGIRPLVMQKGKSESDISRKHLIFFSDDNLLTITGGKLTTFRKMAEDLFIELERRDFFPNLKREDNFSKQKYLISFEKEIWNSFIIKNGVKLDKKILEMLYQQYGRGAMEILKIIKEDQSLKKRIIEENDFIKAEIIYILRNEPTPHLIDMFCRRTEMSLFVRHEKQAEAANIVAGLMASEYSWNEEKINEEINSYLDYIKNTVSFIK